MTENNENCKTENWLCRKYNDFVNDKIETKFVYAALFSILIVFYFFSYHHSGDDVAYSMALNDRSLFEYLKYQYLNWSSRTVIEAFLPFFSKYYIVWYFFDSALTLLVVYSIAKICKINSNLLTLFIFSIYMCLPRPAFDAAGWVATSMNYNWVLALGLYTLTSIVKILNGEKIKPYQYILYFLATVYAASHEQMCALLLGFYGFFLVYNLIKNKKINIFLLFSFLFSLLAIAYILTAPGNVARNSVGDGWFGSISLIQKLEIGFSSTWYEYFVNPNFFVSLCVILMILYSLERKNYVNLVFLTIFAAISLLIHYYYDCYWEQYRYGYLNFFIYLREVLSPIGTQPNIHKPFSLIPELFICLRILLFFIPVLTCFEDKKIRNFVVLVFIAGFASRMLMSFSSSIWASGTRTFIFFYTSFIIFAVYLFKELMNTIYAKLLRFLTVAGAVFAIFTFVYRILIYYAFSSMFA